MPYETYKREQDVVQMEIPVFKVNDQPTCLSWWGCEDHAREVCPFLLSRNFGSIHVCGVLGEDLLTYYSTETNIKMLLKPSLDCPLWSKNKKE